MPPQYSIAKDRSRRDIRPPQRYGEASLVAYTLDVVEGIDSSEKHYIYSHEVDYDKPDRWMIAMQKEVESLHKNGT